jgi:hypothetical protein
LSANLAAVNQSLIDLEKEPPAVLDQNFINSISGVIGQLPDEFLEKYGTGLRAVDAELRKTTQDMVDLVRANKPIPAAVSTRFAELTRLLAVTIRHGGVGAKFSEDAAKGLFAAGTAATTHSAALNEQVGILEEVVQAGQPRMTTLPVTEIAGSISGAPEWQGPLAATPEELGTAREAQLDQQREMGENIAMMANFMAAQVENPLQPAGGQIPVVALEGLGKIVQAIAALRMTPDEFGSVIVNTITTLGERGFNPSTRDGV